MTDLVQSALDHTTMAIEMFEKTGHDEIQPILHLKKEGERDIIGLLLAAFFLLMVEVIIPERPTPRRRSVAPALALLPALPLLALLTLLALLPLLALLSLLTALALLTRHLLAAHGGLLAAGVAGLVALAAVLGGVRGRVDDGRQLAIAGLLADPARNSLWCFPNSRNGR